MQKTSCWLVRLGYLYVGVPVFLFITGWCNLPTALIGGSVVLASLYLACKNAPVLWVPPNKAQWEKLVWIALVGIIWVYLSGIGALVFQNADHNCRNPLFELLVQYPWPVQPANPPVILTYYIGFWLPSALVGKLAHSVQLGFYAQIVWAALGVFLTFYLISALCKRARYWPVFLFILFSGLDVLGCVLVGKAWLLSSPINHLEWWYPYFQFSSFTTQLFWVFNQALPMWVFILLMLHEKNNKNMAFLYACTLLHSTLPAMGALPFVGYWYIKNGTTYTYVKAALRDWKNTVLHSLTFQNIAGAGVVGLISFTYLTNNIAGGATHAGEPLFLQIPLWHWLVCFFLPEVGLFLLLIYKRHKRNVLYYMCWVCLLVYPFIRVGEGPDFCMRATIPALVLLYVMTLQTLDNYRWRTHNKGLLALLLVVLALGSLTPLHEITRTIYATRLGITRPKNDLSLNNFFGWQEGNPFLRYFGKQPKN